MDDTRSKLPEITAGFWIVKILATTLGETGGDAVSMSLGLGYVASSLLFLAVLLGLVVAQLRAARYRPGIYWAAIAASTTAGTTLADMTTRSLGLGYAAGSGLLVALLLASLGIWWLRFASVSIDHVTSRGVELTYWITITISQTLGTAVGDWLAESGLGYGGAALVVGAILGGLAIVHHVTRANRALLFWAAFILTRPLGAALGDFLDKPRADGGLEISRYLASAVLLAAFVLGVGVLARRRR